MASRGQPIRSTIDVEKLVSRADICYHRPVTRSYEGLPVGNGTMGTLVWTRNTCIEMQINRNDFFSQDSAGASGSDSCGACASIRIDFGRTVFRPQKGYLEHLQIHRGTLTIVAPNIKVELMCLSDQDVLLIRIEDGHATPLPVTVEVERPRLIDPSRFLDRKHEAGFQRLPGTLLLRQSFSEKDYFCTAAVGVAAVGDAAVGQGEHDRSDYGQQERIVVAPVRSDADRSDAGRTTHTIAVASAATFDRSVDVCEVAQAGLRLVTSDNLGQLREQHVDWWKRFWERSYVHLTSKDGVADFVERCYTYYLYVMASSSRGAYPPKFNGMLWPTRGFLREWGAQFWLFNEEAMYYPLAAANHSDLADPYFDMYSAMLPAARTAARQRWGSSGVFIPETESFNGPEVLPEHIADELRRLNYGEIPYEEMPGALREYLHPKNPMSQLGQFLSEGQRWTWIAQIASGAAEIGIQAWQRFEHTGDKEWLRTKGYPFLKGAVEFYRNLPTMRLEDDGHYHLTNTNVHETVWGVRDSIYDLAALRASIPMACRAAEVLGIDEDLCRMWREFLDRLTPYPQSDEDDAAYGLGPGTWAACRNPTGTGIKNVEQVWLYPVFFEDWTLLSDDTEMDDIVARTYERLKDRELLRRGVLIALHSRFPVMMAKAGRADDIEALLPVYLGTSMREPPNGLSLWEGLESMTAEHLGLAAYALLEALLQSSGSSPGTAPIINVFPAWPATWNARYSLLARGGFVVTAGFEDGEKKYVDVESNLGNVCRVHNPWPRPVRVYRNGTAAESVEGSFFELATVPGEVLTLLPEGATLTEFAAPEIPSGRPDGLWELNLPGRPKNSRITIGLAADHDEEQ
jgi:hypothetical protein